MLNMVEYLKDRITGKAPKGAKRSKYWRKVRRKFLKGNPQCFICGLKKTLRVHHKIPFHLAPDLELDPKNLITLCENKKYGINCHLLVGHLGNFRRINGSIELDAITWRMKLGKD